MSSREKARHEHAGTRFSAELELSGEKRIMCSFFLSPVLNFEIHAVYLLYKISESLAVGGQ